MKYRCPILQLKISLLALLVGMAFTAAHADEYSDVSQLVRSGKLKEAMARADQYLATKPNDAQMRFIKGVVQRDSGKTAEAIATFSRLTEDYPELPEPYNNLAVIYAGQSQFDKARAALEAAIRTNPSYATAHENLGDIYAQLANQAYNKALQLDSSNPAVPPKLALIREVFGNTKGPRPAMPNSPASAPQAVATTAAKPVLPKASASAPIPPAVAPLPVVATAPAATTASPAADSLSGPQTREVDAAVTQWASAWSARDVKAYLASYGKDFEPAGSQSRQAWEEERQQRITSKASISVKVDKLTVTVNGNHATAKFRQDYKAGGLVVTSRKTLDLAKIGEHWLIMKESVGN
jgi:tetratricopeptide (TPR) repeat protein